jgi:hypothetical protein
MLGPYTALLRFVSDSNRFELAFPQIADKRLTYDELIGRRAEQP